MPQNPINNYDMRELVASIIEEGEQLASETFRQHLRRMEEVLRFDFGTEDAQAAFASQMLKRLAQKGRVIIRRKRFLRFALWVGLCSNRNGRTFNKLGNSEV